MKIRNGYIVAWGEIFLKSPGVQNILKKQLINNLSFFLKKAGVDFHLYPTHSRIFIETDNRDKTTDVLNGLFGVVWFAGTTYFENVPLEEFANHIAGHYKDWIEPEESFALRIRRGSSVRESRERIIDAVARHIDRRVDLNDPDKEIFIERRRDGWFLYFDKQAGPGGMPVGPQGRVLTLMSGGIDSPVAAYLMAKRGAVNTWLHFHGYPVADDSSILKVKELARIFTGYQPGLKVRFLPFIDIQKRIKLNADPKYRILLYRRVMFRIAQMIAKKEKDQALVTGESLGQVSSQTLTNLNIIHAGLTMPVLQPLIGMDKIEIIDLAKKIGTYDISVKPQEDCCTLFVPRHQTAAGRPDEIMSIVEKLELNGLVDQAIEKIDTQSF